MEVEEEKPIPMGDPGRNDIEAEVMSPHARSEEVIEIMEQADMGEMEEEEIEDVVDEEDVQQGQCTNFID